MFREPIQQLHSARIEQDGKQALYMHAMFLVLQFRNLQIFRFMCCR